MFVSLRMVTLPGNREGDCNALIAGLRSAAAQLGNVQSCWVAPISERPVINAGHIVWRMHFANEREASAVTLDPLWHSEIAPLLNGAQTTTLGYRPARYDIRPSARGIWRALIFRVFPYGFPDRVRALEDSTLLLPKYVRTIRSWALSPVAQCEGPKAFTHVWEQEFDSLDGLTGEYMTHPIHWGHVDAFFDAECPEYIVDPHLIQIVATIDRTVMG